MEDFSPHHHSLYIAKLHIAWILCQTRVSSQCSVWNWEPLVLAVTLCREVISNLSSSTEEPPLALSELVETTEVCTTTATLTE